MRPLDRRKKILVKLLEIHIINVDRWLSRPSRKLRVSNLVKHIFVKIKVGCE